MEERRRSCPLRIRLSKSTLDGRLPRPGPRGGSLPQGLRGPSPPPLPPQGPWEPPSLFNRSEEQPSELQSLMSISYAVFCLKKKKKNTNIQQTIQYTT